MSAKGEVVVPVDPINEQIIIAAVAIDDEARAKLVKLLNPDHFLVEQHRPLWAGIQEMERRKLGWDPATLRTIAPTADVDYLMTLCANRPSAAPNLTHHVDQFFWDRARAQAVTGPIAQLLEAVRDPRQSPERVKALARSVAGSFEGYEARAFLRKPDELIRSQIADIRERMAGRAVYPYGIPDLDFFEEDKDGHRERRLIPGAAPKLTTVITGLSGSGKTALTTRVILGLARQQRKVLVGAWEVGSGISLESLAVLSLNMSRAKVILGQITEEDLSKLETRMSHLSKYVSFMEKPFFRRRGEKASNEAHLDVIQGYIEDTGCEVFVADLWRYCLVDMRPEQEEQALKRQQAIADECCIHNIIVQQQRGKDVEMRPDKRPSREGIKGSGGYTEIADTILGVHMPCLWKNVPDNTIEVFALKQRYGKWPIGVEMEWDRERGYFGEGKSIPYDQPSAGGSEGGMGAFDELLMSVDKSKKRKKRGSS